jgi:hypothetical protein
MSAIQISTSVTIINSLLGINALSLTNFTTSAASSIAAGSKIEIASAFFNFSSDTLPNASSWTAITTATTAYLGLTPSGTAGSQIISASWLSYAPTWSTSKQGWYSSTASNIRVVASAYKAGPTSYSNKSLINWGQSDMSPIGEIKMFSGINWIDNVTLPGWYACTTANSVYGSLH